MNTIHIEDLMNSSGVSFGTSGARGLVSQMTDGLCYAYCAAFLQSVPAHTTQVVLGHDLRPSSPKIAAACASAIQDAGFELIYAGALPTPALAYHATQLNAPCIVVTGSHIPFDRNGLKFYLASGEITKLDELLIKNASVSVPQNLNPTALPIVDNHAHSSYIDRYVNFFGNSSLSGMRVAIYEHSSVARDLLRDILQVLGAEVISLGRTDTFVPIDTEAVRPEDIEQAKTWAATYQFDAIVSTDGDADRPLIGDEQGQWFRGDLVGILCAEFLQAQVVVTPVSSNTVVEKSKLFSKVIRTRIGSPYVIAGMEEIKVAGSTSVVGYEANGGFLLGNDIKQNGKTLRALATRDAVLPILALLCMTRDKHCKLSELAAYLPARFTYSNRLQQISTTTSSTLIAQFTLDLNEAVKYFAPNSGKVMHTDLVDGLRITFGNGDIVHLRPSGNAPELRCYAEADSQQHAQVLCEQCLVRLASLAKEC